jgi:hypothetical protein
MAGWLARRGVRAGLVAVAGLVLALVPVAASASSAAPDITCHSGYFRITNQYTIDQSTAGITAQGVGTDVIYLSVAGSCWHAINSIVDTHGFTEKQYQNEGGSCLSLINGYMALETCNFQDLRQLFYGRSYSPPAGWTMGYEDPWGKFWDMGHMDCSIGELIGADTLPTCWPWNFPS